jgi:hypothetical protein
MGCIAKSVRVSGQIWDSSRKAASDTSTPDTSEPGNRTTPNTGTTSCESGWVTNTTTTGTATCSAARRGRSSTRDLKLGLRVDGGDDIDYAHRRPGKRLRVSPSLELFAGRHLRFDLDHLYEHLDVDEGRLYTANLSELRTVYQFNRRAFIRLILQFADHAFQEELYADGRDPVFKHLLTQWLFTYKVNPQTAVYLGYTDNYMEGSEIDLTQLNRTAFFKIGYAWVP